MGKEEKGGAVKVTALDIKKALGDYHAKDFFMTECKNGSTYFPPPQGLLLFDAIAISKSWTRPRIRIYEVKVSRSDFRQDGKWHLYKQYCHEFCFACPKGMIKKEELPDDVGLVYYNPENGAVRQVKKPLYRAVEYDANMLMYIIMNRIDSDRLPFYENNRAEYARAYLQDKADKRYIGYTLRSKMAMEMQELRNEIDGIPYRRKHQELCVDIVRRIIEMLRQSGEHIYKAEQIEGVLKRRLASTCPPEFGSMKYHVDQLSTLIGRIEERENGSGKENGADSA